jgi:FkbM family methyltransferase
MSQDAKLISRIVRRAKKLVRPLVHGNPNSFLRKVSGVIHVGANLGQERILYGNHGLNVIWIEPIPDVYQKLKRNLEHFPRQHAFQYLIADRDDAEYTFHISNNDGKSSSIFDLDLHKELWPTVSFQGEIRLKGLTLLSFVQKEGVDMGQYDALVLDTQGSELLVLKGASPLLPHFRYIKAEAADFESYAGCCKVEDLDSLLMQSGFVKRRQDRFASKAGIGSYYDVLYQRIGAVSRLRNG